MERSRLKTSRQQNDSCGNIGDKTVHKIMNLIPYFFLIFQLFDLSVFQ